MGVAGAEIKSALTYLDQSQGQYAPGEPVSVFQRGAINVKCSAALPLWAARSMSASPLTAAFPPPLWEALRQRTTAGKVVQLTNCQWAGPADANGVAELRILTMNNA